MNVQPIARIECAGGRQSRPPDNQCHKKQPDEEAFRKELWAALEKLRKMECEEKC